MPQRSVVRYPERRRLSGACASRWATATAASRRVSIVSASVRSTQKASSSRAIQARCFESVKSRTKSPRLRLSQVSKLRWRRHVLSVRRVTSSPHPRLRLVLHPVRRVAERSPRLCDLRTFSRVWELRVPALLARLEAWTIEDPDSLGRYRLTVDSMDIDGPITPEADAPEPFMRARRSLFALLKTSQFATTGEVEFGPSVATSDLSAIAEAVAYYLETWRSALEDATTEAQRLALLSVDQVVIAGDREVGDLRLLSPTHPLRRRVARTV